MKRQARALRFSSLNFDGRLMGTSADCGHSEQVGTVRLIPNPHKSQSQKLPLEYSFGLKGHSGYVSKAAALNGVNGSPPLQPKALTITLISAPSRTSFSSNFSATVCSRPRFVVNRPLARW